MNDELKEMLNEKKQMEATLGQISTTPQQRVFLQKVIPIFNERIKTMVEAHAAAMETANLIRSFSSDVVAGDKGHEGQWFASTPDLVIRQGTDLANQMPSVCWPVKPVLGGN